MSEEDSECEEDQDLFDLLRQTNFEFGEVNDEDGGDCDSEEIRSYSDCIEDQEDLFPFNCASSVCGSISKASRTSTTTNKQHFGSAFFTATNNLHLRRRLPLSTMG